MVQYAPAPVERERRLPSLDEIKTSRRIAEAMMQEGSSYAPVGHWTQGAARVAQALVGSMRDSQANRQQHELEGDANQSLMSLYKQPNLTGGMPPVPMNAAQPQPQMSQEEASVGRFAQPAVAPSAVAQALDPSLVEAVKGFEGYNPKATWDYKQHSSGYGTRAKAGEVIDRPEAERRLGDELTKAQNIVQQFAPGAPDGVKKALTSLTYNAGAGWTQSGLGAAVQRGDWQEAQRIFLQYNKAGGQTLPGLVNRRQQEATWFNQQPQQPMALGGPQQAAQPRQATPQPMPMQVADASQGQGMTRETMERLLANPMTRDAAQKMILEQYKTPDNAEYGTSPIYGVDADGNSVIMQMGKNGKLNQPALPPGVSLSKTPIKIDAGTSTVLIDPVTRQPIQTIPKDLAGAASAKEQGKQQGNAAINLSAAENAAQRMISDIDALMTETGLGRVTGNAYGRLPAWTNTSDEAKRAQSRINKVLGGVFLQAYNDLRGAGQISNAEGSAAREAYARLADQTMSPQEYAFALGEFKREVQQLVEIARQKAGGGQPSPARNVGPQSDAWTTLPNGVRIREKR